MTNSTTRLAASLTSTDEQRARRYRNESNVKLDLSQLIDTLGYGPVENEYAIVDGFIDIYIPHHRVIIEAKAAGSQTIRTGRKVATGRPQRNNSTGTC